MKRLICKLIGHNFEEWADYHPDICCQKRSCERCHFKEERIQHQFGDPEYSANDSCERYRICARCGEKKKVSVVHDFGEWKYLNPETCDQTRLCEKCGMLEKHTAPDSWERVLNEGHDCEICSRCKASRSLCSKCGGSGSVSDGTGFNCPSCVGLGAEVCCGECNGTGLRQTTCDTCGGSGWS